MKTNGLIGWYYKHFKTRDWARARAAELRNAGERRPYEQLLRQTVIAHQRARAASIIPTLGLGYWAFRAGYGGLAHLCAGYVLAEFLGKQLHNRLLPKKIRSRTLESILEICLPTLVKAAHEISEIYGWFWPGGCFEIKDILYTALGALTYHAIDSHYNRLYCQIKEASTIARAA